MRKIKNHESLTLDDAINLLKTSGKTLGSNSTTKHKSKQPASTSKSVIPKISTNATGYAYFSAEYLNQYPNKSLKEAAIQWKALTPKEKKEFKIREAQNNNIMLARGVAEIPVETKEEEIPGAKRKLSSYQVFVKQAIKDKGMNLSSAAALWKTLNDDDKKAFRDDEDNAGLKK
jgi:hypothetical protein